MAVDFQVNITTLPIEKAFVENTTQVSGDLSVFADMEIVPNSEAIDNAVTPPQVRNYDFIFGSVGAATGLTRDLHYRSVDVPVNSTQTPIIITNFFTNIVNIANDSDFEVHMREVTDSNVIFDVFYDYPAAVGTVDYALHVYTLDSPPGEFLPTLPTVDVAAAHLKTVVRVVNGVRTYNVFVLVGT